MASISASCTSKWACGRSIHIQLIIFISQNAINLTNRQQINSQNQNNGSGNPNEHQKWPSCCLWWHLHLFNISNAIQLFNLNFQFIEAMHAQHSQHSIRLRQLPFALFQQEKGGFENRSVIQDPDNYLHPMRGAQVNRQNSLCLESFAEGKAGKTRRCKSTRRNNMKNILSCEEILNISKKRDTFSSLASLNASNVLGRRETDKAAKKGKDRKSKGKPKKGTAYASHQPKQLLIGDKAGTKSKDGTMKNRKIANLLQNQSSCNFGANYPLSQSNSYIVFSDKQSTMNLTSTLLSKLSKKLSSFSNKSPTSERIEQQMISMQERKAATVIQKHWRGYLTRKLLQQCILAEQPKLLKALSTFKQKHYLSHLPDEEASGQKYESSLSRQLKELEKNREANGVGQDGSFSLEAQEKMLDCEGIFDFPGHLNHSNHPCIVSKKECMSDDSEFKFEGQSNTEHNGSASRKSFFTSQQQSEMVHSQKVLFPLKQRDSLQQTSKLQSLNSSKAGKENRNLMNQTGEANEQERSAKYQRHFTYNQVYWMKISRLKTSTDAPKSAEEQLIEVFEEAQQKIGKIVEQQLSAAREMLSVELKNHCIDFSLMLRKREQLKAINGESLATLQQAKGEMLKILHSISNVASTQNMPASERGSNSESPHPTSPISEYFTIDLPTEELSPHKKPISLGLDNLRTYLSNIYHQYQHNEQGITITEFLCQILKRHSEVGADNMIERCLIQMLVEILTERLTIEDIILAADVVGKEKGDLQHGNAALQFVLKWASQLDKWELGPIEQVSRNMQQSADVTERNFQ